MTVKINESGRFGRCTERGVAAFERRIGRKLPADYRKFLLQHNGGTPENSLVDVKGVKSALDRLQGLHDGPYWARLESLRKTYAGRMPEGLLPIGTDPFGNVYCLGLAGRWRGKIWFWEHEAEADEGEKPRVDNLKLVAASFTSFLARLRAKPAEPALPRVRTLQQAAFRGDLPAVERLLAAGADPNKRVSGSTPLMDAAVSGHSEIVERLIAEGADVHARDKHGNTAVVMASWAEHQDVIRLLMAAGAKPETPWLEAMFAKWRTKKTKRRRRS